MDLNLAKPIHIILLIILGIATIAAQLGNGFIIAVNSHQWLKSKKLVPCDLLLTCLSIFRFLMQSAALFGQYIFVSSPMNYFRNNVWKGSGLVWMYFNLANFAGTTCLTVFYCVKVSTFVHPLFFWLKSRIDRLVPYMLAISLITLVLSSIPSVLCYWRKTVPFSLTGNLTNSSHMETSIISALNPLLFSFGAINFSICLTASILLIFSLWRHTRNVKKSGVGTNDLSTRAHIKVIWQLMFFLFLYILYFVTMIIALHDILSFGEERLSSDIVLSLYPSVHSIFLIWTNPKLKGAFVCILSSRERPS